MSTSSVTDDEILGYVRKYAEQNDLTEPGQESRIGLETPLAEIGLDSIGVAELLLGARYRLVEEGRISPDATLLDLPALDTVGDLGGLIRSLEE